ncbi:MAG: hypothetical protein K2P38_18445 [Lachnospiraceae bacterium]|nr:hypothetical protein [Lachnospiraceae bacterium]
MTEAVNKFISIFVGLLLILRGLKIAGVPIDHSFLKYKKEMEDYGYQVGKISMKGRTYAFIRQTDWEKTVGKNIYRHIVEQIFIK